MKKGPDGSIDLAKAWLMELDPLFDQGSSELK